MKLLNFLLISFFLIQFTSAAVVNWDVTGRENVMLSTIRGGPLYYPASTSGNFQTYPIFNASSCDTDEGCTTYGVLANGSWTSADGYWQWRSAGDAGTGNAGPPFWIIVDLHRQVSISQVDVKDEATTTARQWATQALINIGNYTANNVSGQFKTINSTTGGFVAGAGGQNYTFTFDSTKSARFVMLWINATVAGTNSPALSEIAIRGEDSGANFVFNGTTGTTNDIILNYSIDKVFGFKNASAQVFYAGTPYTATVTNDSSRVYFILNLTNKTAGVNTFNFRILQFTNDTFGVQWNSTTQTQYILPYPLAVLYDNPVISPSTQTFKLLIQDVSDAINANSTFFYNNSNYTRVSGVSGNGFTWHNATVPINGTGTANFWWQITYQTPDGFSTFNTSVYTQTAVNLTVAECNSTFNTQVLVYYLFDEENQANLSGLFKIDMSYSGSSDMVFPKNFSAIRNNTHNFSICISANATMYANTFLSYNINDTYPIRSHIFIRKQLTNSTFYQNVYTNLGTIVKLTQFTIKGESGLPLANATLNIERSYPGNNSYLTVAMAKTDSSGQASTYLRPSDTYHRVSVLNASGNVLKVFDPQIIVCDDLASFCEVPLNLLAETGGAYWNYVGSLAYTCIFENSTGQLSCSVFDSTGNMQSANLTVLQRFAFNNSISACSQKQSGASVLLTCIVNTTHGNSYTWILRAQFDGYTQYLTSGSIEFTPAFLFGALGILLGVLCLISVFFLGGSSAGAAIFIVMVAAFSVRVFGLIPFDDTSLGLLLAVGFVLIWLTRSRS